MLRETDFAANDAARPYCETLNAHGNLGAELADAPPEVRAAAVVRSRRLPEPSVMRAAWLSLPVVTRDRIGTAAITHSFYSRLDRWTDRPLTLAAGQRCEAIQSAAFQDLEAAACAALPALYGTDAELPRWEQGDSVAAICPASEDASPLVAAIANHLRAEWRLDAELSRDKGDPVRVEAITAEEVAHQAAVDAPLRDRRDLVAFYEHFRREVEDDDFMRKSFDALALALQIGSDTEAELQSAAAADPGSCLSPRKAAVKLHTLAFPKEMIGLSPIQTAIVLHRASWQTLQARAAFLKTTDDTEERWPFTWPVEEAEDEAVMDLLMVSCRDRADAEAMEAHLVSYLQTYPQHPKRLAMNEKVAAHIAIRLRDLSMILGRDVAGAAPVAVPGGIAKLISAHRAAWATYLADPDALVKGSDRRFYLSDAVGEASGAILLAPCADSAEAAAFIEHALWWRAGLEAAGDTLSDGFTCEAQEIRARAGDLALVACRG